MRDIFNNCSFNLILTSSIEVFVFRRTGWVLELMVHQFVPEQSVIYVFVSDVIKMLLVFKFTSNSVYFSKRVDTISVTVIGFFLQVGDLF